MDSNSRSRRAATDLRQEGLPRAVVGVLREVVARRADGDRRAAGILVGRRAADLQGAGARQVPPPQEDLRAEEGLRADLRADGAHRAHLRAAGIQAAGIRGVDPRGVVLQAVGLQHGGRQVRRRAEGRRAVDIRAADLPAVDLRALQEGRRAEHPQAVGGRQVVPRQAVGARQVDTVRRAARRDLPARAIPAEPTHHQVPVGFRHRLAGAVPFLLATP